MKTILKIFLIGVPVLLSGCEGSKDDDFELGKITGSDLTKCACCGGYLITIKDEAYKFLNENVRGGEILNVIDPIFPLYVRLKWSHDTGTCADRIIVHELKIIPVP